MPPASATTWCSTWYVPGRSATRRGRVTSATLPPSWPPATAFADRRRGRAGGVCTRGAGRVDPAHRLARPSPPSCRLRNIHAGRGRHRPAHEPLTKRERDVLRFLASRLTIPEIADELSCPRTRSIPPEGDLPQARRHLTRRSRRHRSTDDRHPHRPSPCSRRPAPPTSCSPSRPDRRCGAWCRPGSWFMLASHRWSRLPCAR